MEFLIIFQLFSVFCWFFSSPSCSGPHLACSSISGYFWHCSWQGKVLQYSSSPHGCDILHSVSSIKLLYPLWISGKNTLYLLSWGGRGETPPPVCYKCARGGRSPAHLLCWEPERRCSCRSILPGGALAPSESASVSPQWDCLTVSARWDPCVSPLLCLKQKSPWWASEGAKEEGRPMVGKLTGEWPRSCILRSKYPVCNRLEPRGEGSCDLEQSQGWLSPRTRHFHC